MGIVDRLLERAAQVRKWIVSSQTIVDLLTPEMEKFNKREAPWDTYTVRMSVDHQSSIRKQTKEAEEYELAADIITRLKGYASHSDECAINAWMPRGDEPCPPCSCGLSALLEKIDRD